MSIGHRLDAFLGAVRSSARVAGERGQATVEFALILPALLLLTLAFLDFGKAFNYWIDETHLANEAVRWAVVNQLPEGSTIDAQCGATLAAQKTECQVKQQANTNELKNGGGSVTSPGLTITFCLPVGTGQIGDPLRATATLRYNWLSFFGSLGISGLTTKTITTTATMRLEHPDDATATSYTTQPTC